MSANRSIKTGLTAAAIVSAWTWAATLLQSSTVAYKFGVSGPFWYASGATIQVLLFAILAVQVKIKAPNAHTFLEIMQARYGKATHIVFLIFGLVCNMVVTAMLLLGGSAVVTDLTGMSIYAACMLIPVGVMVYTLAGGLKATFIADWLHTVYIYIVILVFGFTVYAHGTDLIGSPGAMFKLLNDATARVLADKVKYAAQFGWLADNEQHSYLTMSSTGGIIFGIINIVGNFGTVFVDQAYWQRAVAARPSSTVKGYLLGGLCWFAIPFFLATTLGLSAVALQDNPVFPTYPNPMNPADVSAGLAAVNAAVAIFGSGGAVAVLILIFMAVTSAASAELIAVSSLLTYDVYRSYIKPSASGDDIVKASHINIVAFGIFMGVLAIILNQIGISLGYLYLLMGILIAPAVFPVAATLMWKKQSKYGAIAGALGGFICGLAAWLGVAKSYYGYVNLDSTGGDYPMLAGNLVSLFGGAIFSIVVSLIKPDDYDFVSIYEIKKLDDPRDQAGFSADELEPENLKPALRLAVISSIVLTIALSGLLANARLAGIN